MKLGAVTLQFGGRVEHDKVKIDSSDPDLTSLTSPDQKDQDFTPLSAAGGAIYHFLGHWELAMNATFSHARRPPKRCSLVAGTTRPSNSSSAIRIWGWRRAAGWTSACARRPGVVTGTISGYYNSFSRLHRLYSDGDFEDGLRVFDYTPKNADFYGGEAQVDFHLLPLTITRLADQSANDPKSVKNVITGAGNESEPNPHDLFSAIANRLRARGRQRHGRAAPADHALALQRVARLRQPDLEREHRRPAGKPRSIGPRHSRLRRRATPSLTRASAGVFGSVPTYIDAYLRGTNLTNEEARDHLSFLKEVLPLEGRSIIVGLRTTF